MKNTSSSVFVNTVIQKQFINGPKVSAEFQIIVTKNKSDDWVIECVEPMDIIEIEMMGVKITDRENKHNIIKHFESIGIDLWDEAEKDINGFIAMSGDAVTFVKEQTGIILPTKQSKPNDVVELTRHELEYVLIMNDLKQKFGSLGYYNDKRKTFRRIKIYHGPTPKIEKYMYEKYPHIQTYYVTHPWSGGLCFRLPL
jgi:hypothetical protein